MFFPLILGALLILFVLIAERQREPTPEEKAVMAEHQKRAEEQRKEKEKLRQQAMLAGARFVGSHNQFARIYVIEGDGTTSEIRDNFQDWTCFRLAPRQDADATLTVEMFFVPPLLSGKTYLTGQLKDKRGKVLWSGRQGTRQKVVTNPGMHVPSDMSVVITSEQAERILINDLNKAACTP